MREIIIGLCAAAVFLVSPAAAQFGGDSGAVRVPSMRDSDAHRHYWIPQGALGPAHDTNACRTVVVRKRLSNGRVTTRRMRRCV
jgi:hypothetical protein